MKSRHLAIIAKKEFRGLLSERTILLAILLQLFVALFSSFLMVGLTSMYDPTSLSRYSHFRCNVGYTGNDTGLLYTLYQSPDFRVFRNGPLHRGRGLKGTEALRGDLGPGYKPQCTEPVKITLYTLQNDLQSAIVDVKLKEVFLNYEREAPDGPGGSPGRAAAPARDPAVTGGGRFLRVRVRPLTSAPRLHRRRSSPPR